MTTEYHSKHWTRQRALACANGHVSSYLDELDAELAHTPPGETQDDLAMTARGLRMLLKFSAGFRHHEQAKHVISILQQRGLVLPKKAALRAMGAALREGAHFGKLCDAAHICESFVALASDPAMAPVPRDPR
mgnify:CR=1 FL=1